MRQFLKVCCIPFLFSLSALGLNLPERPVDPTHPASAAYKYQFSEVSWTKNGREITAFIPKLDSQLLTSAPVVVFGHGRGVGVEAYRLTFEHLAKKGIVVVHPEYARDFFDKDFDRMAIDFDTLTDFAFTQLAKNIDTSAVTYAGHSNGAFVASKAAAKSKLVKNLVLIQPAGFDQKAIESLSTDISVTTVWSDSDTVVQEAHAINIYQSAPSVFKQYIKMISYNETTPPLKADHFISLSKGYFFGGKDGASAFHHYGFWGWLVGAAEDLQTDVRYTHPYLYSAKALETGIPGRLHQVTRNF